MNCNCESSLCDHTGPDGFHSERCSRPIQHFVRMEYVGACCAQCASNMGATGGAAYLHLSPDCLDGPEGCEGAVEYRMALSATGRSFPRCDKHWEERLAEQDRINERYPTLQPSDFDPSYAGEVWDEEG